MDYRTRAGRLARGDAIEARLERQLAAALDSDEAAKGLVAPPQAVQVAKPLRAPRKRKAKVPPA